MLRYVLAGASSRALHMYALPVVERYRDTARLVGIFDINLTRAEYNLLTYFIPNPNQALTRHYFEFGLGG